MNKSHKHFSPLLAVTFLGIVLAGCSVFSDKSGNQLFEKIPSEDSQIKFSNDLTFSSSFNVFNYVNFYSGGGVAIGDINNDDLPDIYLTANQKSNKLYLNRGNFRFEDITEKAGVAGTKHWSTGVSMADVNGDGLLDIYVCNAGVGLGGDRKNELFINNGDQTFTERAQEYGLDDGGNSIHASFFDSDKDGDLDMYLLNNYNSKPIGDYNLKNNQRNEQNFLGGDRFYRNDMITSSSGSVSSDDSFEFTNVTEEAGIYSSEIGFGLGISVADLNRDGWMDIYISNDFFERDYLYYNNGDGTFREVLEEKLRSISTTSMGGDIADLNGDAYPEIFITDMLPDKEKRLKTMTDFIGWDQYQSEVSMGYHRKFTRNTLQLNNADGTFSEIGRYAGIEATDWSWGGLMADFNLDSRRDIFVANGIYKDQTNKDFLLKTTKREVMMKVMENNRMNYKKLLELIPTVPVSNYIYKNIGDLKFTDKATEWGMDEPSFSSGSAYGDLDRDGDLDLVVNNINMESFVYRNQTTEKFPNRNWIQLVLKGKAPNTFGVGAQVELVAGDRRWYVEQMPQRGYESSVDPTLHVGLGDGIPKIDTIKVQWPDGSMSLKSNVKTDQKLVIEQSNASDEIENPLVQSAQKSDGGNSILKNVTEEIGIDWKHEESAHNDFDKSPLLFQMRSSEGPPICTGDINGDGKDDFYVGGAKDQPGALFVQNQDRFIQTNQPALEADRLSEDTDCIIFNLDGSEQSALYVASGSSEFSAGSNALADRLYRFDGGSLIKQEDALPESPAQSKPTGTVSTADLENDGDLDLFVGIRMDPSVYGNPVGGYVLENDGTGQFEDVTDQVAPELRPGNLRSAGITDAEWGDINGDGTPDLAVVGEWMPITVFLNREGKLTPADLKTLGLDRTSGWWQSLTIADLNKDGTLDLIGGNHGLNSRFKADSTQPVQMWVSDFDRNGSMEHIFATYNNDEGPYPLALRHNLIQQLPRIQSSYPTYSAYAEQKVSDIFTSRQLDQAVHYQAEQLASVIAWNNGDGSFRVDSLPFRAQLAPIYGLLAEPLNSPQGSLALLSGGNLYSARPQAGPYDAGYGTLLQQDSAGKYQEVPSHQSGFISSGEIRDIQSLQFNGQTLILVARNDNTLQVFRKD